ncbi:glucosyltransferase GtrII-like protein [Variovorax sp. 54]|uniref:glucosyltransferase domain-containing protein n=1 Tax=Variovorax sp. 54 TaxID=2035212 RepID=UPI000C199459|nr:glucosyltransferase domain-containing protein [Variovorax sp. 54]PIF76524.1 glucosyltransferase GtrII-like protein [Variovorax sp. 54]
MKTEKNKIDDLLESRHLKLLLIFFGVALVARGGVLDRGFAVDDYSFGQGFSTSEFDVFLAQGRFFLAAIDAAIHALGVNIADIYISLGLLSLLLQAGLILAVLRFVGAADKPGAIVAGSLMVAHPYFAEILTFRMVLPGYCVGALLTIIALEALSQEAEKKKRNLLISLVATVGMLFIYQGFLNYFSVALIFSFLFGEVFKSASTSNNQIITDHRSRALNLLLVCFVSIVIFLAIVTAAKKFGLISLTSRAAFIRSHEVPERISQIFDLIAKVYWLGEPMGAHWVKVIIAMMLVISSVAVCVEIFRSPRDEGFRTKTMVFLLAGPLLVLATVGVVLPFKDWWPVPRVLSQTSLITGLIFLLAYPILRQRLAKIPTAAFMVLPAVLISAFIFKSNQVFADQQRLNSWDKMRVNRIIARLEKNPDFQKIEYVFFSGGRGGYPAGLNTIQGDMNVSALYPSYSKLPLFLETSGYKFKLAVGEQVTLGEGFCKTATTWPSEASISVVGNLAMICLGD